jgi:phosphatidylethanolamine N-methyltransferase
LSNRKASPTGIVLSVLVYVWYKAACLFEEPFTGKIYAKRDQERKLKKKH